jgi:hypothetical protein
MVLKVGLVSPKQAAPAKTQLSCVALVRLPRKPFPDQSEAELAFSSPASRKLFCCDDEYIPTENTRHSGEVALGVELRPSRSLSSDSAS